LALFFIGFEMFSLLIVFLCGAIATKASASFPVNPGSAELIPDQACINSRLGRLREFGCKHLIYLAFLGKNGN
jgi:hypothetical protein